VVSAAHRLELVWSRDPARAARLPIEAVYGSALDLPDRSPYLVANVVQTVDGVVVFGERGGWNASTISMGSELDRQVMALLRARVDAIVIGAGTFRVARTHQWSPGGLVPEAAGVFDTFRAATRGGTAGRAPLYVVTASGDVDPAQVAFTAPETRVAVVTTEHGAAALEGALPPHVDVFPLSAGAMVEPAALVELVARCSGGLILCEGGPTLLGDLLQAQLVDELFITQAPQLAGRDAQHRRLGLVEAFAATPDEAPRLRLHSLRRADDHLFLRYAVDRRGQRR
jgi:riboflavin biosynthesis pyrimidine reductase